ncbi:MAG TPA: GNAT family N-acetyltransferase [Planctomycetaceae bacterium]|nr:GNAT family N-acetyltransferase [Planctomycetaceae bacterium]
MSFDGIGMKTLDADGLILEPQVAAHAAEMFAVLSDPALYEYELEPPASEEWLRARFLRLETRRSPDGRERWLNWVIRLAGEPSIGYVQATVRDDGSAGIAYALSSSCWGKGFAGRAVEAMIQELVGEYGVQMFWAVLKEENVRSRRLLERLGFAPVPADAWPGGSVESGELLMSRRIGAS